MLKKIICFATFSVISAGLFAQVTLRPADNQLAHTYIIGPTIHLGDGSTVNNGYISFEKGKITGVGPMADMFPARGAVLINAAGMHVYPGFIAPMTTLGLVEIDGARPTVDFEDVGELNPHIRALIAYNAESKIIPTVRQNGVLMAQITPKGGLISGQSSVMQLDAWNWEDATLKADIGVHINWPSGRFLTTSEKKDAYESKINELTMIFDSTMTYSERAQDFNAKLNAMVDVFLKTKKVFVKVDYADDIVKSVNFFKSYGIIPVLVGAKEATMILPFIKENKIPIIVDNLNVLPQNDEEDFGEAFRTLKILYNAGILVTVSLDGSWQQRNYPFLAGTAGAYGMTRDQILALITINAAKILGVDKVVGSLNEGKDATFFISRGDALDIITNDITRAFIKGRDIDLNNVQAELYDLYSNKYNKVGKAGN